MSMTRREFLWAGIAVGATTAVGVVLPVTQALRDDGAAVTVPTTSPGEPPTTSPPVAVVATFPRVKVADLPITDPVVFDYPLVGQTNLLVKAGRPILGGAGEDEDLVAFSRICTHMGCVIEAYKPEVGILGPCPCHFSTFDVTRGGQVVLGQATQSLPQVTLAIEDDAVYATGLIRLVYGFADNLVGGQQVGVSA